jgi:hypothetical protein
MNGLSTYAIIDQNQRERFFLGDLLCQIDAGSEVLTFQDSNEFVNHVNPEELILRLKGAFVNMDGNLADIQTFVDAIRRRNPQTFFIGYSTVLELSPIRELIDHGITHFLVWPNEIPALKAKIQSAEKYHQQLAEAANESSIQFRFRVWHETLTEKVSAVSLLGTLTENFELPKIVPLREGAVLLLDCENLKGFNSIGIRAWVLWIKRLTLDGFTQFIFRNVHSSFLRHLRSINVMMPENGWIDSFYLIYFNEELDIEKEFKFTHGRDFDAIKMELPLTIESIHQNKQLHFVLDDQVQACLSFYTGKVETIDKVVAK